MTKLLLTTVLALPLLAQSGPGTAPTPPQAQAQAQAAGPGAAANTGNDEILKRIDDLMWRLSLGDVAEIDKIEYTSLPPTRIPNPKAPGATNPLIIRAYTFIPKNLDRGRPQPLIVFAHQGIHGNSDTRDAHAFRELLQQGYSII